MDKQATHEKITGHVNCGNHKVGPTADGRWIVYCLHLSPWRVVDTTHDTEQDAVIQAGVFDSEYRLRQKRV